MYIPLAFALLITLSATTLTAQTAAPASNLPPITVPSGGWFPPGWVPRRTEFRANIEKNQGAVVFFGDSIVQGFHADQLFPTLKSANLGITGDITQNIKHRFQDVIDTHPSAVVFLIGSNDAKDGHAPAGVVKNLRAAAEQIHAVQPETPVIVCRLLPRAPRPGAPNEAVVLPGAIVEMNKAIDELGKEVSWITIADTFTPLAKPDDMPQSENFSDGVHPNGAGNKKIAAALEPILTKAGVLK